MTNSGLDLQEEESDPQQRFSVRLLVRHPSLDPQTITDNLKLASDFSCKSGEERRTPKGRLLRGRHDMSKWSCNQEFMGARHFFAATEPLVERLELHKDFVRSITESGGNVELILHLPGDTNLGDSAHWSLLQRLAEMKIGLGVEVFPKLPNLTEM